MKPSFGALRRSLAIVVGVALAWAVTFALNDWLFHLTQVSERANWVFMPAALRLIAVLLFDELGALGLVIGAYLTIGDKSASNLLSQSLIAVSSGLAPLVAVRTGRRLLGIADSLSGLRPLDIVALSLGCAAANAVILNVCLWLSGNFPNGVRHILSVFVGDVIGAAIVLFAMSGLLALLLPRRAPTAAPLPADRNSPWD